MKDSIRLNELSDPLLSLSTREQFKALVRAAATMELPLAAWRLPGTHKPCLLVDLSGKTTQVHPDLQCIAPGFLFAPYATDLTAPDAAERPHCCFLNAHLFWDGDQERLELQHALSPALQQQAEALLKAAIQVDKLPGSYALGKAAAPETKKEHFIELVQKSIDAIEAGRFQKNVCARTKAVDLPAGFKLEQFLEDLSGAYPNAFISLVSVPGLGTWVGATPEILISVDRHQQFRTVALAGTQPKQPGMRPADAVWRQKEIEEQALVSRYIINCLKKIRVREFEEIGPRTIAAANLLHLRTDFTINLSEVNYPNLPTIMLQLLHPTSAVCGLPKESAAAFLEQHELLDRSFFAGFLGPVNLQQETHLFVNLRCMQLFREKALLYAGAGITADSVPEREWVETEQKCQTLLDILDKRTS